MAVSGEPHPQATWPNWKEPSVAAECGGGGYVGSGVALDAVPKNKIRASRSYIDIV